MQLVLDVGTKVLLRNSKRDSKKGDSRMKPKWVGPYMIDASLGKGRYRIKNPSTGYVLKKAVHIVRLKQYLTGSHQGPDHAESDKEGKLGKDEVPPKEKRYKADGNFL